MYLRTARLAISRGGGKGGSWPGAEPLSSPGTQRGLGAEGGWGVGGRVPPASAGLKPAQAFDPLAFQDTRRFLDTCRFFTLPIFGEKEQEGWESCRTPGSQQMMGCCRSQRARSFRGSGNTGGGGASVERARERKCRLQQLGMHVASGIKWQKYRGSGQVMGSLCSCKLLQDTSYLGEK